MYTVRSELELHTSTSASQNTRAPVAPVRERGRNRAAPWTTPNKKIMTGDLPVRRNESHERDGSGVGEEARDLPHSANRLAAVVFRETLIFYFQKMNVLRCRECAVIGTREVSV